MSLEQFKPIEGYPHYAVSTWGNVINTDTGCVLYQEETKKGYLRVKLSNGHGEVRNHKVHRLVAKAFIPNMEGKPQVNHIDGNKKNNSVSNLEWVTNQENAAKRAYIIHRFADMLREIADGVEEGLEKLQRDM